MLHILPQVTLGYDYFRVLIWDSSVQYLPCVYQDVSHVFLLANIFCVFSPSRWFRCLTELVCAVNDLCTHSRSATWPAVKGDINTWERCSRDRASALNGIIIGSASLVLKGLSIQPIIICANAIPALSCSSNVRCYNHIGALNAPLSCCSGTPLSYIQLGPWFLHSTLSGEAGDSSSLSIRLDSSTNWKIKWSVWRLSVSLVSKMTGRISLSSPAALWQSIVFVVVWDTSQHSSSSSSSLIIFSLPVLLVFLTIIIVVDIVPVIVSLIDH